MKILKREHWQENSLSLPMPLSYEFARWDIGLTTAVGYDMLILYSTGSGSKGVHIVEKTNPTKLLLADTLKDMCTSTPLKTISVQKLVARCAINRGTFYYHFKDVQDLINWIYHTDVTLPAHDYIRTCQETQLEISSFVLNKLYENKAFYTQAVQLGGQNNLFDFMLEENKSNWICLYRRLMEELQLSSKEISPAVKDALENAMLYFCYGHFFAAQQWIKNGMKTPPDILAHMLDTAATKGLFTMLEEAAGNMEETGQPL